MGHRASDLVFVWGLLYKKVSSVRCYAFEERDDLTTVLSNFNKQSTTQSTHTRREKKKKAAQTLSRSQPVRILFLWPISHSLVQTACVFAEWKVFIDAFPSRNLGVHQLRPKTKMVEEGT